MHHPFGVLFYNRRSTGGAAGAAAGCADRLTMDTFDPDQAEQRDAWLASQDQGIGGFPDINAVYGKAAEGSDGCTPEEQAYSPPERDTALWHPTW